MQYENVNLYLRAFTNLFLLQRRSIKNVDTLTGGATPFLFFIHPKEGEAEEIYYLLEMYRFKLPVCIDVDDNRYGI